MPRRTPNIRAPTAGRRATGRIQLLSLGARYFWFDGDTPPAAALPSHMPLRPSSVMLWNACRHVREELAFLHATLW